MESNKTYSNDSVRRAAFALFAELRAQNGNFNPRYYMSVILEHYDGGSGQGLQFSKDVDKYIAQKLGRVIRYASGLGIKVGECE